MILIQCYYLVSIKSFKNIKNAEFLIFLIFSKISFYGQVSSTGPSIPAQVIHINVLVSPARPSLPNEQSQIQRWKSILMTQCRIPGKRTLKQCCQVRFYVVRPSCCKTRALLFLQEVVILPGTTGSIWAVPSCGTTGGTAII